MFNATFSNISAISAIAGVTIKLMEDTGDKQPNAKLLRRPFPCGMQSSLRFSEFDMDNNVNGLV